MPTPAADSAPARSLQAPDIKLSVRQVFGIDTDMEVPAFSTREDHVPDLDEAYRF
ncbi:MAG: cobaltochelatase subunit CobS, partial [Alphaproteobacteria bacterium]|nr:cobaltochelatase subunit CobS [Alphaproteobacteria bacterium]